MGGGGIYLNLNEGLKEIRFTSTGLRNNTGVSFQVGEGGGHNFSRLERIKRRV